MPWHRAPEIILTHQGFGLDFDSDSTSSSWASNPTSPTTAHPPQSQQEESEVDDKSRPNSYSYSVRQSLDLTQDKATMADESYELFIRPYEPRDRHACGEVCRLTPPNPLVNLPPLSSNIGEHEHIVPHIWCFPYLHLCPSSCLILAKRSLAISDSSDEAIGFIIGTPDTIDFIRRWKTEYSAPDTMTSKTYPFLRPGNGLYPLESDATEREARDHAEVAKWLEVLHNPNNMVEGFKADVVAEYPAHLHINILPPYQGKGWGRKLISQFCDVLRGKGVKGVHLGMQAQNWEAWEFYRKLRFEEAKGQGTEEEVLGRGERVLVLKL